MECSPSYWDLDPDGLSLLVERGFRTSNEIEREREREVDTVMTGRCGSHMRSGEGKML